jgi:hypothetical protein
VTLALPYRAEALHLEVRRIPGLQENTSLNQYVKMGVINMLQLRS